MSHFHPIFVTKWPNFELLTLQGSKIYRDWFGAEVTNPPQVLFTLDETHFHFLAGRAQKPLCHPEAQEGKFQSELWKYDVAEFFLLTPDRTSYLEFNLSPNGAWWSSFFSEPRVPLEKPPLSGVRVTTASGPDFWQAHAAIPRKELGPLEGAFLNATLILDSPEQRFLTAASLGEGEPDFHRPEHFPPMSLSS